MNVATGSSWFDFFARARSVPRLWRTLRHLRASQIACRGLRFAQRRLESGLSAQPGLPTGGVRADLSVEWEIPALVQETGDAATFIGNLERGILRQLNQDRRIGLDRIDWRLGEQASDRLGTVTLHYHRWIYRLATLVVGGGRTGERAERLLVHYLRDWLEACDIAVPGARPLAWSPYAIATRIGWWVRSLRALGPDFARRHGELSTQLLASLWKQARYLHGHVEWDLRGNHLLRDAVGLAWAGRFFQGEAPQAWLRLATELACDQVREQVLADGGHFERSPMYHLEVMEDLLALAILVEDEQARLLLESTWRRMAEYIRWLRHPDGQTAQFNDGGLRKVLPALAAGQSLLGRLDDAPRRGGRHFPESGLVAWRGEPWTVFFDVGEIGPVYQPGHAHADTLTVECSYGTRRLFVDPGCHSYDRDGRRRYDRATRSHNTVCIDGRDSSEMWHIFRVGRRARPRGVEVRIDQSALEADAEHTGYDHLPGRPRHRRSLLVGHGAPLEIIDTVQGRGRHHVEGGFLLAPQWSARPLPHGWDLTCADARVRISVEGSVPVRLSLRRCLRHPDYGVEQETTRLAWEWSGALPVQVYTRVEGIPEARA